MKYEYKVKSISPTGAEMFAEDELNKLGEEGWELIILTKPENIYGYIHVFKRVKKVIK